MKTLLVGAAMAAAMMTRNAPPGAGDDERRQPMAGFQGQRLMGFTPDSYSADSRTVEAVLSAGSAVRRYYFTEELEISPEAVDLTRAATGMVPLLDSHNQYEAAAVLGTVSNVRIENGQLLGTLKFGETDRAKDVEGMVARGELKGISIGYRVNTWTIATIEDDHETWRATRWELLEVSLVSVPADAIAAVRAAGGPSSGGTITEEEENMRRNLTGGASAAAVAAAAPGVAAGAPDPTRAAETPAAAPIAEPVVRAAEPPQAPAAAPAAAATEIARFSAVDAIAFVDQARALGVEARATELVQQNGRGEVGVETARQALLNAAAEAQRAETAPARGGPSAHVTRDADETSRNAIADAIFARATRQDPSDSARQYMGLSLLDVARARAGLPASERDVQIILRAANTTSDFPLLLEAAANKVLLAAYGRAMPTYRAIARQRNLTDFKTTKLLRVGDFPTLLAYQEDGEIKAGTINEGRETVILGSYGRILRLSRQAIVNDDLGAFDDVLGSIGGMVSRFENAAFYAMKAANSGGGPKLADNVNLFHATHANLAAGSGAAVDVTTLGAGRAAMRKQTDLDGNPLNIAPAVILNGPDTETAIEQFLAPIVAADATKVNPFSSKLTQVTEASVTGNAWELYADPNVLPVFHYGYLESAPGPRVMTHEPFNTDGLAFRVTLDFYSGATDYRGGYRNPGA